MKQKNEFVAYCPMAKRGKNVRLTYCLATKKYASVLECWRCEYPGKNKENTPKPKRKLEDWI